MNKYAKTPKIAYFIDQYAGTDVIFMSKFKLKKLGNRIYRLYFTNINGQEVVYRNFHISQVDSVKHPSEGLSAAIAFTEESGLHPTLKDWERLR